MEIKPSNQRLWDVSVGDGYAIYDNKKEAAKFGEIEDAMKEDKKSKKLYLVKLK